MLPKAPRVVAIASALSALAIPTITQAISFLPPGYDSSDIGLGTNDPTLIVINIIQWALGLLGLLSVIFVLYGGFSWMTSGGNEKQVESAKGILKAAIIGLLIVMTAYGVAQYVLTVLATASGTTVT